MDQIIDTIWIIPAALIMRKGLCSSNFFHVIYLIIKDYVHVILTSNNEIYVNGTQCILVHV